MEHSELSKLLEEHELFSSYAILAFTAKGQT